MMQPSFAKPRATRILLIANSVLWVIFAANFIAKSRPYKSHPFMFEETAPPYIFWGHALPFEEYWSPMMRITRTLEAPSFYASIPLNWYFSRRAITVDHQYWGISTGAYYLLLGCLLSFAQWYLFGLVIDYLRRSRATTHRAD
jgi:hypothetical protein